MAALVALLPLRQPSATSSGDLANLRSQIDALQSEITLTNRINSLSNVTILKPDDTNADDFEPVRHGARGQGTSPTSLAATSPSAAEERCIATSTFATSLGIGTTSPADAFALSGAAYLADISARTVTDQPDASSTTATNADTPAADGSAFDNRSNLRSSVKPLAETRGQRRRRRCLSNPTCKLDGALATANWHHALSRQSAMWPTRATRARLNSRLSICTNGFIIEQSFLGCTEVGDIVSGHRVGFVI